MRREFVEVYQDLYASYARTGPRLPLEPFSAKLSRLVRDSVQSASEFLKQPWGIRPDAMLFLAVNFNELVAKPLLDKRAPVKRNFSDIAEIIRHDTAMILSRATPITGEAPELSAWGVLRAASQVYDGLAVTSAGIWG